MHFECARFPRPCFSDPRDLQCAFIRAIASPSKDGHECISSAHACRICCSQDDAFQTLEIFNVPLSEPLPVPRKMDMSAFRVRMLADSVVPKPMLSRPSRSPDRRDLGRCGCGRYSADFVPQTIMRKSFHQSARWRQRRRWGLKI